MSVTLDISHASRAEQPIETAPGEARLPLIGLTRDRLREQLGDIGVPERQLRMRANQLWRWIYNRGVTSFDDMTDVAKDLRLQLAERFTLERPEIVSEQISNDGTRKWLLRLAPDELGRRQDVETVFIPEEDRGTLVHLQPGGLYADLHLLPHGDADAGAQSDSRRDRCSDAGGAGPAW